MDAGARAPLARRRGRRGDLSSRTSELLDTVILVGDEDVAGRVDGDTDGGIELAIHVAQASPLGDEGPVVCEHLNAVDVADENPAVGPRGPTSPGRCPCWARPTRCSRQ